MGDNVVQIGDFTAHRKESRGSYRFVRPPEGECLHMEFSMDEDGEIVRCCKCGVQVSAYWMLKMICDAYGKASNRLSNAQKAFREEQAKGVVLKAAQRVEAAWRRRQMIPTCPHCNRGIGPNDHFGSSFCNAQIEQRRRDNERIAKATPATGNE